MGKGGSHIQAEQQEKVRLQAKGRALLRQERKTLEAFFDQEFKATIGIIPPTSESLARFDDILRDPGLRRLEELVEFMKEWDAPNTIPEPKSFLHYARLQPVLVHMLEDIVQHRDYLERFITRFDAENEFTIPKQTQQSKSDAAKPNAPIHYAVLKLNGDFLDWLLARPNTEVNMRTCFKQTALTLLCENYDQCMRKSMAACPPGSLETIRTLIVRLLQGGADFNICSSHMKLPFELLLKHCGHEETHAFVEQCVQLAGGALAICSTNERNERVVGFYNNNPNVQVTVELLEIFLRYNDRTNFATYMAHFEVNATNAKKVIRLLLHTACDQKLADCVRLILDRGEQHIFKVTQRKPVRAVANAALPNAPGASSVDLDRQYGRLESADVQKGSELEHRVELKGLLKKVCLMADLSLLQRLTAKISDLIVLNDDPLLVFTLTKAYDCRRRIEDRNALLACAEYLATQETIHMSKRDNSGNTSLHLALKYGFDSVALALLRQRHTYLGMCNNDNLTPLDYGTYAFWRKYLDQCIEIDLKRSVPDRDEIRFNLNGLYSPLQSKAFQDATNATVSADGTVSSGRPRKKQHSWRMVHHIDKAYTQPHKFTSTVTEMTALRQIAQSKELKRLLIHPVLYTFIMVKWTRLCHWNYLNLLLTALVIVCFGHYSLTACSADGPSTMWWIFSCFGVVFVVIRELLQLLILRRSYLSFENVLDIVNAIAMAVVMGIGCHGLLSSFVIISLAMQLTFLMGSLQSNSLATMMYMFKTVSKNFLKSFLLFLPLISAFIYAFHLTYNQSPEQQGSVCDKEDCAEDNFNNFRTFWNATVKTLVMTTGEFEAAAIDFEGGKMLLFILFMFFAPIVILNLINGLAVSDIAAIREESELISIGKKVMLLEQYERGIANVYPARLKRFFPKPFFAEYECRIHVKTKAYRKIVVHTKAKPKQPVRSVPGANVLANNMHGSVKSRLHGSSQVSVQIAPAGKPGKQKALEKSLSKFPWLLTSESCDYVCDMRVSRLALFMRLDQSILDEALAIIEKQQAIVATIATKSTPTTEVPITPVSNVVAVAGRQQRTLSPGPPRKQRTDRAPTQPDDDVLRELTDVRMQLKTVLELLRRKDQHDKRHDTQLVRNKGFKRKAKKRSRKGLKKGITEQVLGDQ